MATVNTTESDPSGKSGKTIRITSEAQGRVRTFIEAALTAHNAFTDMQNKMDAIDIAYARFKLTEKRLSGTDGIDKTPEAMYGCGDVFESDNVTPPIVVSQVDTYRAYLTDVFLSGSPMFPVVSNPSTKHYAQQLETLLDDHASLGGYARELALWILNGVKYNYGALETDWSQIEQFSVAGDFSTGTGKAIKRTPKKFTALRALNMRNTFRDITVPPAEISKRGDYAGYIEYTSKMRVKKELNQLTAEGAVYNADRAINSQHPDLLAGSSYYHDDPLISKYINNANNFKNGAIDWDAWFSSNESKRKGPGSVSRAYGAAYERIVTYVRLMPSDFAIGAPQPNTPQIWKFIHINGVMIAAKRIISAYDYLPILFIQPMEDMLGYQTQGIAEGEIEFQDAASKLFNIRFAAARRAVNDRALYDPEAITPKDVNTTAPAPKIPVRISSLDKRKMSDLYYPVPFDPRGLENVIQDAQTIVAFSKELHGANSPRQGQFQKGNKSVKEWDDTMAGSDNRMRLPALMIEIQGMGPLKSILVLNIYQYGDDAQVVSQKNGDVITVDLTQLRQQVLAFQVADGFTPKSKLASTEMLTTGLQMLSTSPILQQAYGTSIPGIFAHLMQLGGVKGLQEYDPAYKAPVIPAGNLNTNTLQSPIPAAAAPTPVPGLTPASATGLPAPASPIP